MNARARLPAVSRPIRPGLRLMIENVVEDLLLILDEFDGDSDFEDDEDDGTAEPDLGSPDAATFDQERWAKGGSARTRDTDEPFLGAPIACDHYQCAWCAAGEGDATPLSDACRKSLRPTAVGIQGRSLQ